MTPDRLIGIWVYNVDKDILYWDAKMSIIFGHGDTSVTGDFSMFADMVHEEDMPDVSQKVNDCLDGKTTQYNAIYRVTTPDKKEVLVHAWGSVFEVNGDKHLIGACDEVTLRNKIYQELLNMLNDD